jgi:hypothetical protein
MEKNKNISMENFKKLFDFEDIFPQYPPYPSVDTINKAEEDLRQRFLSINKILKTTMEFNIRQYNKLPNWTSIRKEHGEYCLLLIHYMNVAIDPHFDFSAIVSTNVSLPIDKLRKLPLGQLFTSGMSPEGIKDAELRKEYEETLWKNHQLSWGRQIQSYLKDNYSDTITYSQTYFIESYSQSPRTDDELLNLLEKYNYPEEEKINVLKILNIPYQSFREWQSKDGQIKITAKYISFDGQNVTLKTKDQKHETIIFSNLREEEQKYVREQTNEKKEKR